MIFKNKNNNPQKLAVRFYDFIRRKIGLPERLVHFNILDFNLTVREGTLRSNPDYDDAWFLACALRSEIFFDIGANVGDSTLLALLGKKVKRAVLVEPNPEALVLAAENLIRNSLSQGVSFVPAFASDTNAATLQFWTIGTGAAGSMYKSHAVSAAKRNKSIPVSTVTVDFLCDFYQIMPDFIKIDVEGAEHKVLLGSTHCAKHQKTRFLVEMHSPPEMPMIKNIAFVLDWCRSVGYYAWYLAEGTLVENEKQFRERGRCHLLLQPSSWEYPEWLRGIRQGASLDQVDRASNVA